MKGSDLVGVEIDGVVDWHIPGVINDYDTLCGVDGNDHLAGQVPIGSGSKGQKITCYNCYMMWRMIVKMRLRAADFDVESGER